jgi:hypothetical protein
MKRDAKQTKCDVCGFLIWLDEYGNGDDCPNCGWRQTEESADHPDRAGIRNIPSLNSAKKQYREGKSAILANFQDFVRAWESYGELEFTYKKTVYGVCAHRGTIILFESKSSKEVGVFKDTNEFKEKANIDGVLLKDLWHNVTNTDFLQ